MQNSMFTGRTNVDKHITVQHICTGDTPHLLRYEYACLRPFTPGLLVFAMGATL